MHYIKEFGIQVIQDVNNSVMHTLLSGKVQGAEIRGCTTIMGHEKTVFKANLGPFCPPTLCAPTVPPALALATM